MFCHLISKQLIPDAPAADVNTNNIVNFKVMVLIKGFSSLFKTSK